jgi:multiple sugar transport system permease protein
VPVKRHRLTRGTLNQGALHIVLLAMSFIALWPFVWSVFASFKAFKELTSSTDLLPHTWTLNDYSTVISSSNFLLGYLNSAIAAVSVTAAGLLTSAAVGYVFAKFHFWGKEKLFLLLLATLMVPFAVVLVPLYITISHMGLDDRLAGIIVTGFWSTFGIFMMRQFMESIPTELIEASRIDGASEWTTFFRVVIPLTTAPLAALGIFIFLGNWDSYLWPLVVLTSPDKQTLPVVLAGLTNLYWTRYDLWAAGSMMTIGPVVIVYLFASKYFIQGIAMTGLKA